MIFTTIIFTVVSGIAALLNAGYVAHCVEHDINLKKPLFTLVMLIMLFAYLAGLLYDGEVIEI